jgi:hypothetical protein
VITLAEECHHRSLKVQLYNRKVDETCLTVRDEATKCKAAQELIKVLTNQVKSDLPQIVKHLELSICCNIYYLR